MANVDVDIRESSHAGLTRRTGHAVLLGSAVLLGAAGFIPHPARYVELPVVLLAPGYTLLLVLFRRRLTEIGRPSLALFSFFLSAAISVAACLVLFVSGIKLDAHSCGLAIGGVSVVLVAYSWAASPSRGRQFVRGKGAARPTSRQVLVGCGCVGVTVAAMVGVTALSPPPKEPPYVSVTLSGSGGTLGAVDFVAPGALRINIVVATDHMAAAAATLRVGLVGATTLQRQVALSGGGTQTFPVSLTVPPLAGCDHRVAVTLTLDGRNYTVDQYIAALRARC